MMGGIMSSVLRKPRKFSVAEGSYLDRVTNREPHVGDTRYLGGVAQYQSKTHH